MSLDNNPLTCLRCGQLRVVYYLKISGPAAVLKVVCPKDRIRRVLRLPIANRDKWIGIVTDQIYRCTKCGQSIPNPAKIARSGRWVVLFLACPIHGLKDSKRYIIDIIYPIIQNIHQNPMATILPDSFGPSKGIYPPPPPPHDKRRHPHPPSSVPFPSSTPFGVPSPNIAVPPPSSELKAPAAQSSNIFFCSDCGATLQPGALFCVVCGAEIKEEEYKK